MRSPYLAGDVDSVGVSGILSSLSDFATAPAVARSVRVVVAGPPTAVADAAGEAHAAAVADAAGAAGAADTADAADAADVADTVGPSPVDLDDDEPIEVLLAAAACAAAEFELVDLDAAIGVPGRAGSAPGATAAGERDARLLTLPSEVDDTPGWDTALAGLVVAIVRIVIGVGLLYGLAAWLGRAQ